MFILHNWVAGQLTIDAGQQYANGMNARRQSRNVSSTSKSRDQHPMWPRCGVFNELPKKDGQGIQIRGYRCFGFLDWQRRIGRTARRGYERLSPEERQLLTVFLRSL